VYDFQGAFQGAVISDPDHCLVVELRAWGCAPPLPRPARLAHALCRSGLAIAEGLPGTGGRPPLGEGRPQVSLFSGLVGSDAMQAAYSRLTAQQAPSPLLRFGGEDRGARQSERIVMAGPGGRGRVEVAVSEPPGSSVVEGAAVGGRRVTGAAPALQCCVMSVCLPWDALARDILFKSPAAP